MVFGHFWHVYMAAKKITEEQVVLSVMFVTRKQWHGKTVIESCVYFIYIYTADPQMLL